MKTELEIIAENEREKLLVKNIYNADDSYSSSHKNAISDGDEKGMGDNNGVVGTSNDNLIRNDLLLKNKFRLGREYKKTT